MGVVYIKNVEGPAELGIWKIEEDTDALLREVNLSVAEEKLFSAFRTDIRKKQWLAYRRMIKELISPQRYPVHYDDSGKPFLAGSTWNISVTHSEDFAGVILSREVRVGLDLERIRPRIEKVKEKFLSEGELSAIPQENMLEYLTLGWCAKEAVYKLFGLKNLDFRKNIRIIFPSLEDNCFYGDVIHADHVSRYKLFHEKKGDLMVVWAIEDHREDENGKNS